MRFGKRGMAARTLIEPMDTPGVHADNLISDNISCLQSMNWLGTAKLASTTPTEKEDSDDTYSDGTEAKLEVRQC